ncbi:integrase [Rhizobium sp. BJ04]|nr:integrase [Rhizobium sp. BJ04]WEA61802.1 integrase [Rhizobium sp. BJ04]
MSVYKPKSSPFYHYDFEISGHRFHGTTKTRNKRDAEAIERQLKEAAKCEVEQLRKTGNVPMTIDMAVGRYWTEKAQYRSDKEEFFRVLDGLVQYFGKHTRLDQIDDSAISALVASRRSQFRWGKFKLKRAAVKTISNATINRRTLIPLRAIFRRAKLMWGVHLPQEPHWSEHLLREPKERVRELHHHEQEALDRSIRDDYRPWFLFIHLSARRYQESLIRWSDVNWEAGEIRTIGKGGLPVWTPIIPSIRAILEGCRGHHPVFVFTYVAQRSSRGKIRGQRYPITYWGGAKPVAERPVALRRPRLPSSRLSSRQGDKAPSGNPKFEVSSTSAQPCKYNHYGQVRACDGRGGGHSA